MISGDMTWEEIRELEEKLKKKQMKYVPTEKKIEEKWGEMAPDPGGDAVALKEIQDVANKLKQRRIVWGLTQGQLGELICYKYGAKLSQTTVSRFEMMDCTLATARRLYKPMGEMIELIDKIYDRDGPQQTESLWNKVKESIGEIQPTVKERKRRVTYTDQQINALDALFEQCDSPSSAQLTRFASTLGLGFSEVRVWFCNRRQKKRKTIFSDNPVLAANLDGSFSIINNKKITHGKNKETTVRAQLKKIKKEAALGVGPLIRTLEGMPKEEVVINVSQKI